MTVSEIISIRRKTLGLTLDDVAKQIGVGKSTIQRWESGFIKNIRSDKINPLARALQLDPKAFIVCLNENVDECNDNTTPCDEEPQIEPVKYKPNGIDALAVLEHVLEDWLGIKGKGKPTAEAEIVSFGAYPEYAELTFKHNDGSYTLVFRRENK